MSTRGPPTSVDSALKTKNYGPCAFAQVSPPAYNWCEAAFNKGITTNFGIASSFKKSNFGNQLWDDYNQWLQIQLPHITPGTPPKELGTQPMTPGTSLTVPQARKPPSACTVHKSQDQCEASGCKWITITKGERAGKSYCRKKTVVPTATVSPLSITEPSPVTMRPPSPVMPVLPGKLRRQDLVLDIRPDVRRQRRQSPRRQRYQSPRQLRQRASHVSREVLPQSPRTRLEVSPAWPGLPKGYKPRLSREDERLYRIARPSRRPVQLPQSRQSTPIRRQPSPIRVPPSPTRRQPSPISRQQRRQQRQIEQFAELDFDIEGIEDIEDI